MEKQNVSAYEYAQKLSTLWNQTIGSEWHKNAACFVKSNVWTKKEGVVRVYFLDGYFEMKQASNGEIVGGLKNFKYGIDGQVKELIQQLSQEFRCSSLMPAPKEVVWLNEDGEEVDAVDPDAVVRKEVY